MYDACDDSINEYLIIDSKVDYWKNDKSIRVTHQKLVHRSRIFMLRYPVGWNLCVQWRDGLMSFQSLKDLKKSHPVETDKYSVDQDIYPEPAYNWWVNAVLKKSFRILSLIKKRNTRYLKKTHKFGIEVPKSVAQ